MPCMYLSSHKKMVPGFLSKPWALYKTILCLSGSLHGEIVLQIVGERVVYVLEKGSIQHPKGFYYCYNLKLVMMEEPFLVLYRIIFKQGSI